MKKSISNAIASIFAMASIGLGISAIPDAKKAHDPEVSEPDRKNAGFNGMAKMAGTLVGVTAAIATARRRRDDDDNPTPS